MEPAIALVNLMENGREIHPLVNVSSLICIVYLMHSSVTQVKLWFYKYNSLAYLLSFNSYFISLIYSSLFSTPQTAILVTANFQGV